MAKNFLHKGSVASLIAASAVQSGGLVVQGTLAGVALHDAAVGAPVEVQLDGVWTLPKTDAQAWTVGQAIYAIPSTGKVTTAATAGNVFIGVALEVAANPSDFGVVRLNGSAPVAAAS